MQRLRPRVRTRQFVAALDKRCPDVSGVAFLPRGAPWPLEALPADKRSGGSASENQRHIQYHYDVSNAFYALFLDPEFVYSCAYFIDWTNDLAQAQHDKLEMICRKLRRSAGESLLDIGCGWGALVCHAARHHGVRTRRHARNSIHLASEKVAQLGLQDGSRPNSAIIPRCKARSTRLPRSGCSSTSASTIIPPTSAPSIGSSSPAGSPAPTPYAACQAQ
jgi:cyclopropane-fatty-acyl-phospholipid synthase